MGESKTGILWRIGKIVLGISLLLLGLLGLFLPFLQGVLMIVVGLSVLSTELRWARRIRERVRDAWRARMDASENPGLEDAPDA